RARGSRSSTATSGMRATTGWTGTSNNFRRRRPLMTTADRVGETTFATPSDTEIEITRVVAAPRTLVFDAWTKPEHIANWMLGPPGWTMLICEVDLRAG